MLVLDYLHCRMGLQVPAPSVISMRLRDLGMDVEARNEGTFVQMAQVIQYGGEPLENVEDSLRRILCLTFQDKEPNWGLMITLVAFTATVAAECLRLGGSVTDAAGLASAAAETMLRQRGA